MPCIRSHLKVAYCPAEAAIYKECTPVVKYFPSKFCSFGANLDWEEAEIADCFFLIGNFYTALILSILTGGNLIKVLHFQIYWKCLRALSLSLPLSRFPRWLVINADFSSNLQFILRKIKIIQFARWLVLLIFPPVTTQWGGDDVEPHIFPYWEPCQ